MLKLFQVREHERGLWFRRGNFIDLILPGSTWLLNWQDNIVVIDTQKSPKFEHPLLGALLENATLRRELETFQLGPTQRMLVWRDGELLSEIGPGLHAFWKTNATLRIEPYLAPTDASDPDFPLFGRFGGETLSQPKMNGSLGAMIRGRLDFNDQHRALPPGGAN